MRLPNIASGLAVEAILKRRAREMLDRADVHTDNRDRSLKRRRTQPRGSRPCLWCRARQISANAAFCAACRPLAALAQYALETG